MRRAEAAVGQRLAREVADRRTVAEPALELGEALGGVPAARRLAGHLAVVTMKSRQALMLATSGTFTDQVAVTTVSPPSLVDLQVVALARLHVLDRVARVEAVADVAHACP